MSFRKHSSQRPTASLVITFDISSLVSPFNVTVSLGIKVLIFFLEIKIAGGVSRTDMVENYCRAIPTAELNLL